MHAPPSACMLDLAFALQPLGAALLPRQHHEQLADWLDEHLAWLGAPVHDEPAPGVHRLNLAAGAQPLLSQRTRLTLRVPRGRASEAAQLQGRELRLGDLPLRLGVVQPRELRPWGTLYAHQVAADADGADEAAFMQQVQAALDALGVQGRVICGRAQRSDDGALRGHSLMVDGLSAAHALRLMDHGIGPHRRLGCGLFVPHKSAAAVGAPP